MLGGVRCDRAAAVRDRRPEASAACPCGPSQGVSRCGKTPLSIYLGQRGYKARTRPGLRHGPHLPHCAYPAFSDTRCQRPLVFHPNPRSPWAWQRKLATRVGASLGLVRPVQQLALSLRARSSRPPRRPLLQVANLPLIPNCPVPKELFEIDQRRIVGLVIVSGGQKGKAGLPVRGRRAGGRVRSVQAATHGPRRAHLIPSRSAVSSAPIERGPAP
jgi:hypothetical protein